jgi:hypothetical protein
MGIMEVHNTVPCELHLISTQDLSSQTVFTAHFVSRDWQITAHAHGQEVGGLAVLWAK